MPLLAHHRVCEWCCGWWCGQGQPGQGGQRGVLCPLSPGPGTWPGPGSARLHSPTVLRHPRCHRPGLHVCMPCRVVGRCGEVCGGAIVDGQTSSCTTPCARQEQAKPSPPSRWGTRGAVMFIASAGSSACFLRHPPASCITLIVIHHPPASSSILQHPPSSNILHHHPSSSIILHHHPASPIVLHHPPSSFIVLHHPPPSSIILHPPLSITLHHSASTS